MLPIESIPKSILFVHYHYPPLKNSGIYKNYFLSVTLAKLLDKVFVITTDNAKILPTESLHFPKNLELFQSYTFDYRSIIAYFDMWSHNKSSSAYTEQNKKSAVTRLLIKMQRSFPFNFFFAEGSVFYIIHGYIIGKKIIKKNQVKVVYSSFMPYNDHVIAYLLKMRFPELLWVADFRDLHIEPIYKNTIWLPLQKWFEKKILKKANFVTAISNGIQEKLKDYHSQTHTISKGVDHRSTEIPYDIFTIAYVGSMFGDFRDPSLFFEAYKLLISSHNLSTDAIRVVYAGKDGSTFLRWAMKYQVESYVVDQGLLHRGKAIEIQSKSHINLLLTSSSDDHSGVFTGKLFEYIESQNPILCLVNGTKDDEFETLFNRYRLGRIFYSKDDVETIKSFIEKEYLFWINNQKIDRTILWDDVMKEMSWDMQAKKLLSLIK